MERILTVLSVLTLYVITTYAQSNESALNTLLREFRELELEERDSQISKRVESVMELLTEPLDRSDLMERAVDGTICPDGIVTTCYGSVQCDDDGKEYCKAMCDSSSHGKIAHFYCKCKAEFTGQLCETSRDYAEKQCVKCKTPKEKGGAGGKYCYVLSSSKIGYYCYNDKFKIIEVSSRGLYELDDGEGEKVGSMARALTYYLEENL